MKRFSYINVNSLDEAVSALKMKGALVIAGGTDILNLLKARSHPEAPKIVINIKNIPGLDEITENETNLTIGALTKLSDIVENKIIKEKFPLLSEAARSVASPQIRNMGTLGGNICQETRCWYYRYPENVFHCLRKGGKNCPALISENRFHSIFGGAKISDPPCQSRCPGKVDIPSYLSMIRNDTLDEAAKILLATNPMPAITGRVCPHFCQEECNRKDFDEFVSIRNIERFVGDYVLDNGNKFFNLPENEKKYRVAIIGSGPAGLSAAYYLRRLGYQVTIFERLEKPGGMMAYAVPPYRLPSELVERVVKNIENMGIQFRLNVHVGRDILLSSIRKEFDAIFLSTGAWIPGSIGIEGEQLTSSGLSFLTQRLLADNKIIGRNVLVIGGGNVAVDVGITAKRLGAKEVTLACLESRDEMPAFRWEIEQALEEGIKIMPSWGPSKVLVKNGSIKIIELIRCTSVFDEKGNFCPRFDYSVKNSIEADEVIMAVGQRPDISFIDPDLPLEIKRGLIIVNPETQETNISGIFAGGDVTTGTASIIEAMAAGRKAAFSIDKRLGKKKPIDSNGSDKINGLLLSFNPNYLKKTKSIVIWQKPVLERNVCEEDTKGLNWEQVKEESNRCFNCCCVAVSPSDLAPALIALEAKIETTKRTIPAEEFFRAGIMKSTVLEEDEIVKAVEIPKKNYDTKQAFLKFRIRKTIDFPIVGVAVVLSIDSGKIQNARIALSGVAPIPLRSIPAEAALIGKEINEENAEASGEAATIGTIPLSQNRYIIQIIKTMIKRAILSCR